MSFNMNATPITHSTPTCPPASKRPRRVLSLSLERIRPLHLPADVPTETNLLDWNDTSEDEEEALARELLPEERRVVSDEEEEYPNWPIHRGYLWVTLRDVALERRKETLERWLDLFTPSTQPRSKEENFMCDKWRMQLLKH